MGVSDMLEAISLRKSLGEEYVGIYVKLLMSSFDGLPIILPLEEFVKFNWSNPGLTATQAFRNGRIIKFVLTTTVGVFLEYELATIANLESYLSDYKPKLEVLIETDKGVELVSYRERIEHPEERAQLDYKQSDLVPDGLFS